MKQTWMQKLALSAVLTFGASLPALTAAELQTVPSVNVSQYLGKWYEIARLPQVFQLGCTAVTAEYSLNDDGSVKVFNSCRFLDPEKGFPITITGKATPVDESNSKLDVTFFNGLTKGKYWVLELDPEYQWALVGEPDREALFVLSRAPTLDDAIYQDLLKAAVEKHGYDISKLEKTKQLVN
ncbi:MAG: lipocalin family protein [Pseudobdellovibrionaceae bacterium]|nr:lipocalin family protein [Pseudobdellovibrionaceae bacterium]